MAIKPSDFEIKPINLERTILIPLEEYKELLVIRGRYQEIKEAKETLTLMKITEKEKIVLINKRTKENESINRV